MKTHRFLLVGFAALLYYTAATLYLTPDTLYIGHDGECIIESIKLLFDYAATPFDLSVFSPVEGLGTVVQPVGVWLHPGCWPFHLVSDGLTSKLLSCVIVVVCISGSTYGLARTLDLPPLLSLISAQCTSVLFFPPMAALFFEQLSLAHLYALWPFLGVTTALSSLFLVVVLRIRSDTPVWWWVGGIVALPVIVIYSVITDPLHTPVLFAPAGVVAGGVLLASPDRSTFWRRGGALVVCLVTLLAGSLHHYYQALSGYASRQVFPHEIGGEIQQFDRFVAFLFQSPFTGLLVVWLIGSGAAVLVYGSRQQQGVAGGVLVVLGSVVASSLYYVYGGVAWNRPPPSYFEHGAVPTYVLVVLLGASTLARRALDTDWGMRWRERLASRVGSRKQLLGYVAAVAVPGCMGALVITITAEPAAVSQTAAAPGPILQRLTDEIAISPGDRFLGSVTTLVAVPGGPVARQLGVPDDAPFSEELINSRTEYLRIAPHDLYQAALWRRKIPTLEQYNTLATTPMYFLFSRALARPHDYQMKNFVLVTKLRPGLLACLGCRFVITDLEINDPRLSLDTSETNAFDVVFRLYEMAEPNLGQYSPVNVRQVATAAKAIEAISSDEFNFQEEVVVFDQVRGARQMVPAENARMAFERGGVRVQATSRGRSLLVLPLQFSHALTAVQLLPAEEARRPRLLRANLVQAAVLFSGTLDIRIVDTFGPWGRAHHRMRDIEECRRLGMAETGEVAYPDYFLPYRRKATR